MKNHLFLTLFLSIVYVPLVHSQASLGGPLPPLVEIKDGKTYWYGMSVNEIVDKSELVFEGRILMDSAYMMSPPGMVFTYTRIMVLKQFKGNFKSDTLTVVYNGGHMRYKESSAGMYESYAIKGDEAVFSVSMWDEKSHGPGLYCINFGNNCSFIKICDKKDVIKEVYEPIEVATGQPYVDIHPNTCKGQQQKPKK